MSGLIDEKAGGEPLESVGIAQFDKRIRIRLLIVFIAAVAPFLFYKACVLATFGSMSYEWLFLLAGAAGVAALAATFAGSRLCVFVGHAFARMNALLEERDRELATAHDRLAEQDRHLSAARRRLEAAAQCDPLTGLASRRRFDEYLQEQWDEMVAGSNGLAMISLTIDHFQLFNDNYGRPAGDRCLRDVADVLAVAALRQQDLAARCGNEEFCILLPDLPPQQLESVAEIVRCQVFERNIARDDSPLGRITVSVGAAFIYPEEHGSPEFLRVAAQQALRDATRRGRNACSVRSDLVPPRQNYGMGLRVAL
ncbi:MAG: GGDEF domain-containing protein [Roseovarius sp.]|jgi:diguanylate cyclase (GGDEF)-like protein|nr:GGDEF domain-containing protein [Roseovarius sp.]